MGGGERGLVKYSFVTFACRVTQAYSLGFEEELLARGGVAAPPEQADLVVVNTCSVTATADQGARQTIRRIARDNPAARIVVTGCYATRRPDEIGELPNVSRVVLNDDKPRLIQLIAAESGLTTAARFGDGDGACGVIPASHSAGTCHRSVGSKICRFITRRGQQTLPSAETTILEVSSPGVAAPAAPRTLQSEPHGGRIEIKASSASRL